MISVIFSRIVILAFGVLYPAYSSYKAVRSRDVKKYVQWMMYWIVFAFFTCIETFTDIFLSWFPFYYEFKVIVVIWLLSPATKGSSTLYRKFVHPMLSRRETDIDDYLSQAKEKSYSTMMELGSKGVNYATSVIMQTAIKSMTNLGNAKEIMGRITDDRTDGGIMGQKRGMARQLSETPIPEEKAMVDQVDSTRNKRAVSVDSALKKPAAKPVNNPETIVEVTEAEPGDKAVATVGASKAKSIKPKSVPAGGDEASDLPVIVLDEGTKAASGSRSKSKSATKSSSRLRGAATTID